MLIRVTVFSYSHFDNVVRLVIERWQTISLHDRLHFWHHSLFETYKYLLFRRL